MALLRIGNFDFRFGPKRAVNPVNYDDEEPYMPGGGDAGAQDDYAGGEYDGGYADDGYDAGYADDGYDDEPLYDDDGGYGYEDGRGADYYDEEYYDGYGEGDEYADEYAEGYADGYGEEPYYDDGYGEGPVYPQGWPGEALRFADEHDWVTWLLLALFPPLGIWLLWRNRRYNRNVTIALTALSALWMVLALVLLFANPFGKRSDTIIEPEPVGAATQGMTDQSQQPAENAAQVVAEEEVDDATAVYLAEDQPYYHKQDDCVNIPEDSTLVRVNESTAIERSLLACPYCLGSLYSDGQWDLIFVNGDTEDRSNIQVYCSRYNSHFHTDPSCSDLGSDAHVVSLKDALMMSKTTCEICCPSSGKLVYCTLDGTYYHVKSDCSGMKNASRVTYAEARVIGKKRCPRCIGGKDETEVAAAKAAQSGENAFGTGATYYVWATPKGQYYHIEEHCSGMQNAQRVPLADMLKAGRPACPTCAPNAETVVYGQQGNPYYHSNNTCSGMTRPVQGILVNAMAAGLQRCPVCWKEAS
ncbi:MAG: hypothetical protein IKS52_11390 [Clostridia bacterium]|nr:hypothetical protein [Clostridia bacterium]